MFVVKKTSVAKIDSFPYTAGDVHVCFIGKDGFAHLTIDDCEMDAWKRKSYAERYIEEDRINSYGFGLSKYWKCDYKIIEI